MTYTAPTAYRRTDAELADPALSWARPDRAFFAAGACHILAWAFLEAHPHPGTDRGLDVGGSSVEPFGEALGGW